jgi:hypothetical protein
MTGLVESTFCVKIVHGAEDQVGNARIARPFGAQTSKLAGFVSVLLVNAVCLIKLLK